MIDLNKLNCMNEQRLLEVIEDIIISIENRENDCSNVQDFNRVQRNMFIRMQRDVASSVDGDYSEFTKDIIESWKNADDVHERGKKFMDYIYDLTDKKYILS